MKVLQIVTIVFGLLFPAAGMTHEEMLDFSYYRDVEGAYSVHTIQDKDFIPVPKKDLILSYTTDVIWLKVKLPETKYSSDLQIRLPKILNDSLEFYQERIDGSWVKINGGLAFENPYKKNSGYYFKLEAYSEKNNVIYIRSRNTFSHYYFVQLLHEDEANLIEKDKNVLIGVIFGWFLIIGVFNLFVGLSVRDVTYVYYSIHAFSLMVLLLGLQGFFQQGVFGLGFFGSKLMISATIPIVSIFSCLFCIRFLDLKNQHKLYYYLLSGWVILDVIAVLVFVILDLSGHTTHYSVLGMISIIYSVLAILAGYRSYRSGNQSAKFYLWGWSLYFSGILVKAISLYGVIPVSQFSEMYYVIATGSEVIFMAFALANRYKLIHDEKLKLEFELGDAKETSDHVIMDNRIRLEYRNQLSDKLRILLRKDEGEVRAGLRSLISDISVQTSVDEKSNVIQSNSDDLNVTFIKKLKEAHPKLTKTELDICAMLKLGYKNKEIANNRGTSEGAVKVAVHRIKKKIDTDKALYDYLITF